MNDPRTVEVLKLAWPRLPSEEAGTPVNFAMEVLELLRNWCQVHEKTPEGPMYTCFVGMDRVLQYEPEKAGFSRREILFGDTPLDLLGHIFVCGLTRQGVWQKSASLASFNDCRDLCAEFENSTHTIIWFNAAQRTAFWSYVSNGVREWMNCAFRLGSNSEAATLAHPDKVDDALRDFHSEYTHLPSGLADPWFSAKERIPRENLENRIRDQLYVFMRTLRGGGMIKVYRELLCTVGRCDVTVSFPECNTQVFIELKVLRSRQKNAGKRGWSALPAADQVAWAEKGVRQVFEYRKDQRRGGHAYSCCFDGRDSDEDVKTAAQLGTQLDVRFRRYYMYSSAEDYYAKQPALSATP